jgi:AcrR family transcriptional regulator
LAKARGKILESALALFNERGSHSITTNHIAQASGVSPGNLYYHFKNKEEIIRTLYNQMGEEWERELATIERFDLNSFMRVKSISDRIFIRYHFIHTELYALCQIDEELHRLNQERLELRKAQTKAFVLALIESERFEPLDEITLEFLSDSIWMYAIFWEPYQEMIQPQGEESKQMANIELLLSKFLRKSDND